MPGVLYLASAPGAPGPFVPAAKLNAPDADDLIADFVRTSLPPDQRVAAHGSIRFCATPAAPGLLVCCEDGPVCDFCSFAGP